MLALLADAIQLIQLADQVVDAIEVAAEEGTANPRTVCIQGLEEATELMQGMCGNEGQLTVLEEYLVPLFAKQAITGDIDEGWEDIDAGEYADFMGDICEAGNEVMTDAFNQAYELLQAYEEVAQFLIEETMGSSRRRGSFLQTATSTYFELEDSYEKSVRLN